MFRLRFLVGWLAPLALLAAAPAWAGAPLSDDPALQALIRDALAKNPDLERARLVLDADRERVPQAGALPDPTVSFGWQNDGLLPGQDAMGLTYATLMASQPLSFPGKRAARQKVAAAALVAGQQGLERLRLRLRADVERGYVGLLLLRAQGRLQRDQLTLWRQAVELAKARAAVGQGNQADVLRAQLELARLEQGRIRLASAATLRVLALNRLAGRPPDQAIDSGLALDEVPLPALASDVVAGSESARPELVAARAGVTLADLQADVARLDRQPDFAVQAGVMPKLAGWPMWQVGVSVSLPAWSANKQDKALTEAQFRAEAGRRAQDDVRQLLAWRTRERQERLRLAAEQTDWLDREVIARSQAAVRSVLGQFGTGKAPFVAVLEALGGLYGDQEARLQLLADAHAAAIALREGDLGDTVGIAGATSMASAPMPASGMPGASMARTARNPSAAPATTPSQAGSSGMAGM